MAQGKLVTKMSTSTRRIMPRFIRRTKPVALFGPTRLQSANRPAATRARLPRTRNAAPPII
nr:hypothetical protein [Candidatus Sigynarchaeota archaeon]